MWSDTQPCVNSKNPLIRWFIGLLSRSLRQAPVGCSLSENLCPQPWLSPPVSYSTHLRIPHQRFSASLHQSHINERHYTLQSVWFKNDLESFPSAVRNGKLPRDKLRIHPQYSKDIKGFKMCIGFIGGVGTAKKGFYQMWNFHNRVRGMWVIMIPGSVAALAICSRACIRCMFSCSIVEFACHWSAADTNITSVCIYRYPKCSWELEQITFLHFCSPYKFPLHCKTKQQTETLF